LKALTSRSILAAWPINWSRRSRSAGTSTTSLATPAAMRGPDALPTFSRRDRLGAFAERRATPKSAAPYLTTRQQLPTLSDSSSPYSMHGGREPLAPDRQALLGCGDAHVALDRILGDHCVFGPVPTSRRLKTGRSSSRRLLSAGVGKTALRTALNHEIPPGPRPINMIPPRRFCPSSSLFHP
jgi:hypothetical protein